MDMRTRLLTSALLLTLCCAALPAQEQNYVPTPVTISKEKVKLGDKTYYSHVVLERQTLYSIAKAYGVAVEDIYAANPELELEKNGLKLEGLCKAYFKSNGGFEDSKLYGLTRSDYSAR